MFLYQLVSEPFSGSRYNILDLYTNYTGLGMLVPEFLPITDNSISLDLSKASKPRRRHQIIMEFILIIHLAYRNDYQRLGLAYLHWAY